MNKKIKFGIFGLYRGSSFYSSVSANGGEIVAVCDRDEKKLEKAREQIGDSVALYRDFDEFLNHSGLDAVFLCNTFDNHAKFAIRALEKNIHVLSECISNATMAEGVALVRAAEKSSAVYMLAENYPYMKFNLELKRIADTGTLGKIIYAEGEYNHPVCRDELSFVKKIRPYEKHWRNFLPRTYYITHSLGPLMHITGANPIRVTAMPVFAPRPADLLMGLDVGDRAAIITCLNDDDSVFKVTGCAVFGAHGNSYRICGTKGQAENLRDGSGNVLLSYNKCDTPENMPERSCYQPSWNDPDAESIEKSGHGGGDFIEIREFFKCIRENTRPFFDVYRATTMASVAILSHRSVLERGMPYDIPDFRLESDRQRYENDTLTPFWGEDGSAPTLPCSSHPDYKPSEDDIEDYKKILETEF